MSNMPGSGDVDCPELAYDSGPADRHGDRCDYCGQGICGDVERHPDVPDVVCCSQSCILEIIDATRASIAWDLERGNDA